MSSVHGLLCLGVEVGEFDLKYGFWNPSTDEFQFLPYPDSRFLPCTCSSTRCLTSVVNLSFGLGFVAESQDYKFVRFMTNFYEVGDNGVHDRTTRHVAVYSSKNNSWKELPLPYDLPAQGASATYVNGFCYWKSSKDVILSFDLSTDNFSSLPCPNDIERDDFSIIKDVYLIEMDGSLCLVIQFQLLDDSEKKAITTKLFSFWVYESSSPSQWTRKINLDVRIAAKRPVWLGKKNNNSLVLLLHGLDGALLEYNYATTELKKIDQIQDHHPDGIMMISPYVEANIADKDDDGVDRISQLPDHIILIILSLLSLKEAASTSVLSTCWRDLWRHIPNLVFPSTDHAMMRDKDMYTKWVNSVVELHRAPSFKEFSISLPLDDSIRQHTVTKWLELAFSRGVEALVLNLVGTRFGFLEKSFLLKSTNLKSLTLKCMKVSGESIRLLLCSCPLLELLIIKYAVLESDLEVCGSVLKHLDIQYCRGGKSIKGYAPNLTYLRFDSGPKLCRDYRKQYPRDPPLISLISSKLTTLEFTLHSPKIFLEQGFPQMATLRKLIVTYYNFKWKILHPITSLLRALPYLEELEIKQQHYISSCYLYRNQGVNNIESFCHCHLKVFKFEAGYGDLMKLMSYILDNCVALEKIILYNYGCYRIVDWEYVKQLQSKLPSTIQLITS